MSNKRLREPFGHNDFSKHELTVTKKDGMVIHDFGIPGEKEFRCKFIHLMDEGVTVITGDFYRWTTSRIFYPRKNGYVSGGYWREKIEIGSKQVTAEYCKTTTLEFINEMINSAYDYGYRGKQLEEYLEWLDKCKEASCLSEREYVTVAYDEMPEFLCSEDVPFGKKYIDYLPCVFDAFNAICQFIDDKVAVYTDRSESRGSIVKFKNVDVSHTKTSTYDEVRLRAEHYKMSFIAAGKKSVSLSINGLIIGYLSGVNIPRAGVKADFSKTKIIDQKGRTMVDAGGVMHKAIYEAYDYACMKLTEEEY